MAKNRKPNLKDVILKAVFDEPVVTDINLGEAPDNETLQAGLRRTEEAVAAAFGIPSELLQEPPKMSAQEPLPESLNPLFRRVDNRPTIGEMIRLRAMVEITESSMLNASSSLKMDSVQIGAWCLYPQGSYPFAPNLGCLPARPLEAMQYKSGLSMSQIAVEFTGYYAKWIDYYQRDLRLELPYPTPYPIPLDLLAYVSALHVQKGFDPPWIDKQLDTNLRDFQQFVIPAKIQEYSQNMSIDKLAKGYYEIFLAAYYPDLANPDIRVEIVEAEKAAEEERKKAETLPARGKRAINIFDITPGEWRKGREL